MTCHARMRPFRPINDTEVACDVDHPPEGRPDKHSGTLRDYAYPGSQTVVGWMDDDRRSFRGDWPGDCPNCILPFGHRGRHAT